MESRSKRFVRAGDLLLQRVANVIQESVSPNDVAMRVGGDEFLILCTHCPNDQAHALVDHPPKALPAQRRAPDPQRLLRRLHRGGRRVLLRPGL